MRRNRRFSHSRVARRIRQRLAMEDSCGCQMYKSEEEVEEEEERFPRRRMKRTPPRPPKLPKGRIPVRRLSEADSDGFAAKLANGVAEDIADWMSAFSYFNKKELMHVINNTTFIEELESFLDDYIRQLSSNL